MTLRCGFTNEDKKKWKTLLKKIQQILSEVKYDVKRTKLKDWAHVVYEKGRYKIRINRDLPYGLAVYALLEEVAHILRGFTGEQDKDHDETWGIIYSRLIRQHFFEQI